MGTHCPYCKTNYVQYAWQIVKIQRAGNILDPDNTIQAIEVYCPHCHTTLSVTPLPQSPIDA